MYSASWRIALLFDSAYDADHTSRVLASAVQDSVVAPSCIPSAAGLLARCLKHAPFAKSPDTAASLVTHVLPDSPGQQPRHLSAFYCGASHAAALPKHAGQPLLPSTALMLSFLRRCFWNLCQEALNIVPSGPLSTMLIQLTRITGKRCCHFAHNDVVLCIEIGVLILHIASDWDC